VNSLPKSKLDDNISMFVGMDLHKNYLQIAVMNEKGKVLENSKVDNNLKQVGDFFDNLNNECIVMESSCVWYITYTAIYQKKSILMWYYLILSRQGLLHLQR
jgi:hypothetical protein